MMQPHINIPSTKMHVIVGHIIGLVTMWSFIAVGQEGIITATDQVVFHTHKVEGVGPGGSMAITVGDRASMDPEIQAALPATTGTPAMLSNTKEYYLILNGLPFYYQAYKAGRISQTKFIDKANSNKWVLADTSLITDTPALCGIAIVSGLDENGTIVHIADANQNNDFSDDVIHPTSMIFRNTMTIPVVIEYPQRGKLLTDTIALGIGRSSGNDSLALSFTNPEFRYSRFSFNGKSYYLCTAGSGLMNRAKIAVIPDRPYFGRVSADLIVELGEMVNLDGYLFTFSGYRNNGSDVVLSGEFASAIVPDGMGSDNDPQRSARLPVKKQAVTTVASQAGFLAPEIAGLDVFTGDTISLSELKGKWVYVDFWSTNCGPCIAEFPELKALHQKLDRNKISFVGVVAEYGAGSLKRILDEHQLPWPTIQTGQPDTSTDGYEIYSFPTTFLIDPNGVIRHKNLRAQHLESKLLELMN